MQNENRETSRLSRRVSNSQLPDHYEKLGPDYTYADEISQHYSRLENFALKSKSLAIRDAFSLSGTSKTLKFEDLRAFVGASGMRVSNQLKQRLVKTWSPSALLALARVLANQRSAPADLENAYRLFLFLESVWGLNTFSEKDELVYVETLGELGYYEEQDNLSERISLQAKHPVQVALNRLNGIHAKSGSLSNSWVDALNQLYTQYGLAAVRATPDESLAPLERLRTAIKAKTHGPLVSVIMPTYQGDQSMVRAIQSLLNQSWENLEIIVVDDSSDRAFDKYLLAAEQLSDKVQVVRNSQNLGSYSARNTGLRFASGEFVTVLDDDDWAHGDKIATQVQHLLNSPDTPANLSLHGRVTDDLRFVRLNNNMFLAHVNYSSLMVRRCVIDEIGGWDPVNRGGDSEYMSRITAFYGTKPVLVGKVPLSFSRTREGSLTSGELVRGYMDSSRVLYANAFKQWQVNAAKSDRKLLAHPKPNSYPIPSTMGAGRRRLNLGKYDLVFVTDFRMNENLVREILAEMRGAQERGYRVGYIHAEAPFARLTSKISPELFAFQLQGGVEQIGWSDVAEVELLIVRHHSVYTYLDQMQSNVTVKRALIVAGTIPRIYGGTDIANDLGRAQANLDRMFGIESEVIAESAVGAEAMEILIDPTRRLPLRWKSASYCLTSGASSASQSPQHSSIPVIGRHGSAHESQWPDTYADFSKIYLQSGIRSRFPKGDRKNLLKRYPELDPSLVQFYQPPRGHEIGGYLSRIDFWVYFPRNETLELEDRLVLEAMLHRKLVVLPSKFAGAYGAGPLYVDTSEVSQAVRTLWKDRTEFKYRIQKSLAYVEESENLFMAFLESDLKLRRTGSVN